MADAATTRELINRNTAMTAHNHNEEATHFKVITGRLDALEATVKNIVTELKKQLTVDIPSFEPVNSNPPSAAAGPSDDTS
jgi:hypothetical protein